MEKQWVKQRHLAFSPFAITEVTASQAVLNQIYKGFPSAVSAGFPEDGRIPFFRAGAEDIGDANTNMAKNGAFDWPFRVYGLAIQLIFPRVIIDGADLRDANGQLLSDPLAARKLASRYTRFAELYLNNSRAVVELAGQPVADLKLTWVGSGPMPIVRGLSISSGPGQNYVDPDDPQEDVHPSVAAFAVTTGGHGKKDLWNFANGLEITEQTTVTVYTETDSDVVELINSEILADGDLYEDVFVGIRPKCGLYGERTILSNYGAV